MRLLLCMLLVLRLSSCLLLSLFGRGSGRIILMDHISIADIKAWLNWHYSCISVVDCRLVVLAVAALVGVVAVRVCVVVLRLLASLPFFMLLAVGAVVMVVTSLVLLGYEQLIRSY